ncbi:LysR family transcriptional regulator [Oceanobacillus piezotolerans]|uniref:LysR family transcriptional regulator n=1 Tax=Oceanobacillus piezotolerans TaxID=2448030 RepID=A0A498D6X6_9BACI|nr:LysR family transcriptional regulator [Oceanobacillus piezotolerans]RLL41165.1 LysR family transcriptional regulator [Oceanobacillus piezotolerans]
MEIKDLIIFQSVAQNGSISKAANELNYVQSHVTARIKTLESCLQTQLFYRHSRGTTLNSEGKKLLNYSEKILSLLDEITKAFHDSEKPSGTLEIGTVESVMKLPNILSAYHRAYPDVDLTLKTGVTKDLIDLILKCKLDGAFVTGFGMHPDIEQMEVFKEKLVLISANENANFHDLINKPLLVFNSGCCYRSRLENWISDEGVVNAKIMEFGTLETILGSVISGLGISLVPQSTVVHLETEGHLQCHSIPEKYSSISTVFIRRADSYLTNTMKKFMDTITEFANTDYPLINKPIFNVISNKKLTFL